MILYARVVPLRSDQKPAEKPDKQKGHSEKLRCPTAQAGRFYLW